MMSRIATLAAALVLVCAAGIRAEQSDESVFANIDEHFRYGSIGTEERVGLPYWIWRALPIVFEDKLPKRPGTGYERIGFMLDPARQPQSRPIGTSYTPGRFARVGLNCATCHVGSYRETPSSPRQIVAGMPANQMDLQSYANFLTACAKDPRFSYSTIMAEIRKENPRISWLDRLLYRFVIRATRNAILERARENAWFNDRPPQGVGRVDTFNPYKVLLKLPLDATVGTADLPSLWNQRMRRGMSLHWDGNNDMVEERNKSAAIGAGATPDSLDLASMRRIEEWILDLRPPAFPAARIDRALAAAGADIYTQVCAGCHATDGPSIGRVTDIADIKTDPQRLESFSAALSASMNTIGEGKPWRFSHFKKTNGYANMPLDGIWLRAPYLHNGSVPDLQSLLSPNERPAVFFRGYDVYDWDRVGFISSGADAELHGVRFDTASKGNGNGGHVYGSTLSGDDKRALLEFLKTL
jgi:mono/diheme cytochrome c family protein